MKNLIVIPTEKERALFLRKCEELGLKQNRLRVGNHALTELPQIETGVAQGGLGKTQFGVQTQYFIDRLEGLVAVLCVGASGGLKPELGLGDIVVATETVEHDIRKYSRSLMPRFSSNEALLGRFRALAKKQREFSIHFGPVASGDEDIMTEERKTELREQTGAIAVAWEGAGGARACRFSHLPFSEVRGISDSADHKAEDDFFLNLELVMSHLAELTINWVLDGSKG